jgi:hypothetical protein
MEAKLIVVGGKATKGSISLKLPTVVGRSRQVGITLAHRTISRRHAELFEKAGLLMIRDLGSLNGTMVNGDRIKEAPLLPNAKFTIGPLTFRAEYQYKGDLSKLPAATFAEESATDEVTTEPLAEFPDFEAVDEAPAKSSSAKEDVAQKGAPAKPSGDPFEDLLNELG